MSLHIHMSMKNQIKHQTAWLDFHFYITEMIYCNLTIFWYFIPQNLMKRKIISLRSLIRWTLFHNPIMTQFLSCFPTIAFCGNCIYLPHLENRNSSALLSPSLWFLFFYNTRNCGVSQLQLHRIPSRIFKLLKPHIKADLCVYGLSSVTMMQPLKLSKSAT